MQKNEVIDLRNYRVEDEVAVDAQAPQHLSAGTTLLLGQYTITGYLNCGGFGITYRARDSLSREVVIKECFPSEMAYRSGELMGSRTPKFKEELEAIVQHFVKEAHRLATARHDNVVHVHQIFEENDTAYMAMDFIDGQDLLDIVEADPNRFSPREVEQISRKMLHAIKYVHGRGMLHRDISPDNILIDNSGEPILIDFGAAREYASQSSYRAFSKLKFVKDGYSPQEFYIAGSEQGAWSDLYSFAASMYHVMTGRAPEDGQKRLAALAAKKPDPYVPLAGNVSGYPMRFLRTFDKALSILPEQRIQSADEWLKLLAPRKPKVPAMAAKPVARVREKLPAFEAISVRSLIANLFTNHMRPVAASIAGIALLSGLGIFAVQLLRPSDVAQTAFVPTPPFIVADPRLALIDPAVGGLPGELVLALSLDDITTGVSAQRAATPPEDAAAPIIQARPEIATVPVLDAPDVAVNDPVLPEILPPASRMAGIGELTMVELVSAPQVPMPEIAMTSQLVSPAELSPVSAVPAKVLPLPDTASVAVLDTPTQESLPEAELVPPTFVVAGIANIQQIDGFQPGTTDQVELTMAAVSDIERPGVLSGLPVAQSDTLFSADVAPPPPSERLGPLAAAQIVYAHWDIRMPFEADLERVRNSNTAVITTIVESVDLAVSGSWIEEGVIIYSLNGERLEADTPLNVHILRSLTIDPDGYARATVRYRNPTADILDRGLLAVPVVRQIGLADGSIIEARMVDMAWVLEVMAVGDTTNGLKIGDILTSEVGIGAEFSSPEALTATLEQLVKSQLETAVVSIVRDGSAQEVEWHLARERPAVSK